MVGAALAVAGSALLLAFVIYQSQTTGLLDFRIYLGAAGAHRAGGSFYDYVEPHYGLSSTYPPLGPLLFVPWTLLDLRWSEPLWTVVNLAGLALAADLVGRCFLGLAGRRRTLFVLFGVALAVPTAPVWMTLNQGQVNLWLWLAVLADMALVRRDRRGAGLLIGLATAVKLVPGIFGVFLLVIRRWRAAVLVAVGAAAGTLVGALAAPDDTRRYFTQLLWDTSRVGPLSDGQNNSIRAVLAMAGLPNGLQVALWLVALAVLVPMALRRAARAWRDGHDLYAVVLVGCAGALASPVSWTHHLVFLLLGLPLLALPAGWSTRARVLAVAGGWLVLVDPVSFGAGRLVAAIRVAIMVAIVCGGVLRPTPWLAPDEPGERRRSRMAASAPLV